MSGYGSFVVDEVVFPITRLWLADGMVWVEARRDDIFEPVTIHHGTEFRIHAPDGTAVFSGLFKNYGRAATAVGDRGRNLPASFTIAQSLHLIDADDGINRPVRR